MPVPRLLGDPAAACQNRSLSGDLVPQRPLDTAQRVDVLGLGAGAKGRRTDRPQRNVGVAAQRTLLHPHIGYTERTQQVAQHRHVRPRHLWRLGAGTLDRLRHDLDQRYPGPVVVQQRIVGAVDAAGGAAHVQRLAGVFLHVGTLDARSGSSRRQGLPQSTRRTRSARRTGRSGSSSACPDRSSSSGKAAPLGNRAVQRQPDPDGRLDRLRVHDRQRAW